MATQSQSSYQFSDFKTGACNAPVLFRQLLDAGLTAVSGVQIQGTTVTVTWNGFVSAAEATTCDTVVKAHDGAPFSPTVNAFSDPSTHTLTQGADFTSVLAWDSGPLPAGTYTVIWSAEMSVATEGVGNRAEVQLIMNGQECSDDSHSLPVFGKYQDGATVTVRAGDHFILTMQARAVGSTAGSIRRIRVGLLPATV